MAREFMSVNLPPGHRSVLAAISDAEARERAFNAVSHMECPTQGVMMMILGYALGRTVLSRRADARVAIDLADIGNRRLRFFSTLHREWQQSNNMCDGAQP